MHDKYKTDSDISKTNISNTVIDGPGISVWGHGLFSFVYEASVLQFLLFLETALFL